MSLVSRTVSRPRCRSSSIHGCTCIRRAGVAFEVHDGKLGADFADRVLSTRLDLEHASGEFFAGGLYTPGGGCEGTSFLEVEFYVGRDGKAQRVGLDLEDALKGKIWFEKTWHYMPLL